LENAAYAFKMAAGVLLAVLLVTIMTYVLNTYRDTQKTILDAKVTESIAQYNEQFRAYEKAQMYGTDVLSCLNLAYSMNVENRVWDTSGISGTSRIISNNDSGIDERAITVIVRMKQDKPLQSTIKLYGYTNGVGETPVGIGKGSQIQSEKTIEDILGKNTNETEVFKRSFKNIALSTNLSAIGGNETTSSGITELKIGPVNGGKFTEKDHKNMVEQIKMVNLSKVNRRNSEFDYTKNNWIRFEWKTVADDLKTRHFKWVKEESGVENDTGRINKIVFQEI
jgi:hypothetical protein